MKETIYLMIGGGLLDSYIALINKGKSFKEIIILLLLFIVGITFMIFGNK